MTTLSDFLALGFSDNELMYHMPPRVAEIARVIGLRQAIKFCLHYGGGQFFIPQERIETSALADLVGPKDAEILCHYLVERYYCRVEIPGSLSGSIYRRLRGIKLLREGKSYRQIAQEVGADRSTVKKWSDDFVRQSQ